MIRLNTITDIYNEFVDDLYLFLLEYNLAERFINDYGRVTLKILIGKVEFNRIVKAQFDLTEKAFDVIVNDGTLKYGFVTCELFGDFGDRVVEIFLQKISKRGRYISDIFKEIPSIIYSVDEDVISGELREALIKLGED